MVLLSTSVSLGLHSCQTLECSDRSLAVPRGGENHGFLGLYSKTQRNFFLKNFFLFLSLDFKFGHFLLSFLLILYVIYDSFFIFLLIRSSFPC